MREQNKQMAEETIRIMDRGSYTLYDKTFEIKQDIIESVNNTEVYKPAELEQMLLKTKPVNAEGIDVEITSESTLDACYRLKDDYVRICALNFASAKNPGGGFLKGSSAQEESLARSSSLFESISKQKEFYEYHKKQKTFLYSDHMIYSPEVVVIRDSRGNLIEPYYVSIISSAAVNAGMVKQREPVAVKQRIEGVLKKRIEKVLALAIHKEHEVIVLGAFGCGVFKNSPFTVARLFKECLLQTKFKGQLKKIVFAVYDTSESKMVLKAFKQTMDSINS